MLSGQINVLRLLALLSFGSVIQACGGSSRNGDHRTGGTTGIAVGGTAGGLGEGGVSGLGGAPAGGNTGDTSTTNTGGTPTTNTGGKGGTAAGGAGGTSQGGAGGTKPGGSGGISGTVDGCTQILAAPQSPDWYIDGIFEGLVGAGRFELLGGGTGINHYGSASDEVWNATISHRCTAGSGKPDRLMLVVWGHSGYDTAAEWETKLREVLSVVRLMRPTAKQIILQPAAGGKGCPSGYASKDLDPILMAAQKVAGPDVLVGARLEVTCADITGKFDELSPDGARKVGRLLGEFYSR